MIATPFVTDFTHHRSTGPIGISILPPALPALQQWLCASWVRTCILLEPCFSWIQIIRIKSSAGSTLSQSVYVFICSSNLPGLQVLTIPWEDPCLSSELAWLMQAQTEGLLWRVSRDEGLVKDHEMLFGASKLPLKNAAHLCRKTRCQSLTNPVIQVLQPAAKGS